MDAINFAKQVPSYLDQNLHNTAIISYLSDQEANITNFDIKPASKPGKKFASAVFRVKIKFTCKSLKLEASVSRNSDHDLLCRKLKSLRTTELSSKMQCSI